MAVLDSKKTYKALLSKGFQKSTSNGKHHKFIDFWHEGKLTQIYTKFSHNDEDIRDKLISDMARQVRISRAQFIDFASCTLTEKQYIKDLQKQGIL